MDCDPEKQKEMQEKNPDLVPSQHELEWVCSLRSRKLKSASFQERSTHEDDDSSDFSSTGPLTARSTASSTVSAFSSNSTVSYSSCASTASGRSTVSTLSGNSTVSYSSCASKNRSTASSLSTSSATSGTRAAATSATTSFSVGPAHGGGARQAGGSGRVLPRTHSLEAANEIRMMLDGESPSRLAADKARTSPSQIITMAPPKHQSPARRPRVQRSISATSANEPMVSGDIWGRTSGSSQFNTNPRGLPYDHRRATPSSDISLGRNQTIHGLHQPQGAGHKSNHIAADARSSSGNNYPSPELQAGAIAGPRSGGSPVGFRRFGSFGHSPSRFAQEEQCSREGQSSGKAQGRCPAPRMPPVVRSSPAQRS